LNAPAIAVAALKQAVETGKVLQGDIILFNITGGGVARAREDLSLYSLQPNIIVSQWEDAVDFLEDRACSR